MKFPQFIFIVCLVSLCVSACGQKGPLYLPDTSKITGTTSK
ncbi:LPS translocon maturation chaperone LptM [Legionella waltersii]|nr:lipoprotein [Legionella waltersii]